MEMKLGTAKADITPPFPVPLAGYSCRGDVFDDVARPLYVRVWLFEQVISGHDERRKALLVQADLIWWDTGHVLAMKRNIEARWGIKPEFVFFHASHTHGGPQTTDLFSPLVGVMSAEYIAFLERKVEQAIANAHERVEAVTMEKGTGLCEGIGVNRRLIVDGVVNFTPNPDGPNDQEVTVIRCLTEDGRTKGLLFHFTCHPTTTSANRVNSEYCGAAMEQLDLEYGEGVSCFLQGCCGDIRPNLHKDGHFYSGDNDDVQRSGALLADAVERILRNPMSLLKSAQIEGWLGQTDLPFRHIPLNEFTVEIAEDDEIVQVWRAMMDSDPQLRRESVALHAQLLKLADGFALMGLSGEVVIDYGLWVKSKSNGQILPLGYSNGMVGYVPTAVQIGEGGYESVTSGYYFGYPAPFADEVEVRMKEVIDGLMGKAEGIY